MILRSVLQNQLNSKQASFDFINRAHLLLFELVSFSLNCFSLFVARLLNKFLGKRVQSFAFLSLNLGLVLFANLFNFRIDLHLELGKELLYFLLTFVTLECLVFLFFDSNLWH